jgi:hypothetical protein
MTDQAEDQALGDELDKVAMVTAKLALEAVTAWLKGDARIVIEGRGSETWISFRPTTQGMNQS